MLLNSFFSSYNIGFMEGRWMGGAAWGGNLGAECGVKQPSRCKQQCCALRMWHKLIQSTG